jgi:hypothetical protein
MTRKTFVCFVGLLLLAGFVGPLLLAGSVAALALAPAAGLNEPAGAAVVGPGDVQELPPAVDDAGTDTPMVLDGGGRLGADGAGQLRIEQE